MKKQLMLPLVLVMLTTAVSAKPKQTQSESDWKYRPECAYKGTDGVFAVNFWSFSEKKFDTLQAAKEAVHITLFVGAKAKPGCQAEPFLIHPDSLSIDAIDFFDTEFFTLDGGFRQFVLTISPSTEKEKTKGGTLYRTTVHVDRPRLQAFLITKGFLKDPYASEEE